MSYDKISQLQRAELKSTEDELKLVADALKNVAAPIEAIQAAKTVSLALLSAARRQFQTQLEQLENKHRIEVRDKVYAELQCVMKSAVANLRPAADWRVGQVYFDRRFQEAFADEKAGPKKKKPARKKKP